ncbi:Auxin efflux carrier-like protein [Thalictrum thalictroides]|uniref:Auxin efflux carrier-like protein n=1 Tax=Thalictrum thalictroides TaxID=46969 RepID=A0A7J6WU44_THATH|nr:Auxin efflux carrier-like protein [Thalictrum thalictroides]
MKILDLFVAASIPVLKFLLVAVLGSFLAIDGIDILGEDARKHLNKVVFYVFNPALIATNLARTITVQSMVQLWFMPLNILITYIIGSALGLIVIKISRAPSHLKGVILGCCSAGNLGSMFLVIIPAICKEKESPFGDPDICNAHGMAYVSLSMAVGAIYLWTYVYNIVRISASKISERVEVDDSIGNQTYPGQSSKPFSESCREPLLPSDTCSISEHHADHFSLPSRFTAPMSINFKQHLMTLAGRVNLKKIFAPSTIGAIVGFIIGIVPQVRWSMIGASAPLRVIENSASLLGDGSVPVLTLIVGGNLKKGLNESGTPVSLIVGVVIVRYVLQPLFGVFVVKGAAHCGFVSSDPLYQFVLMLQYAVPPALNIGTITQLFGAGESEYSVIMLWTYALASVSLTIWSTFFMWMVI